MESLESTDPRTDSDGASLPPPRRTGPWLRLGALLVLGIGCLASAWLLRGAAAYALIDQGPQDLGNLVDAPLEARGARGAWVRGIGELRGDAVSFRRRGERSPFVLGRLIERSDLWVLLPVPEHALRYVPPRMLEGRLLSKSDLGLRLRPVLQLMDAGGSGPKDHILLVGARPAQQKTDLVLLVLLATLGLVASIRFVQLAMPARGSSERT